MRKSPQPFLLKSIIAIAAMTFRLYGVSFSITTAGGNNTYSSYNVGSSTNSNGALQGGIKIVGTDVDALYYAVITYTASGGDAGAGNTWVAIPGLSGGAGTILASGTILERAAHSDIVSMSNYPGDNAVNIDMHIRIYPVIGGSVASPSSSETYNFDLVVPTVAGAVIACNTNSLNSTYPHYATLEDIVTFSVTGSEDIIAPTGTLAETVVATTGSGTDWVASIEVAASVSENGGLPVAISVTLIDLEGNSSETITVPVPNTSSVIIDHTSPSLSCGNCYAKIKTTANDYFAKANDDVILEIKASETLLQGDVIDNDGVDDAAYMNITIGTQANTTVVPTTNNDDFSATLTMTDAIMTSDNNVNFTISGIYDRAGNTLPNVSIPTDGKYVYYDSNPPGVDAATYTSDNDNTAFAKDNDVITLTFVTDEAGKDPSVQFQGGGGTGTAFAGTVTGGPLTWTAALTVTTGLDEDDLSFAISVSDSSDNDIASAHTSLSSGSAITIDYTDPTVGTLTFNRSDGGASAYVKEGESVTVTLTAAEDLKVTGGMTGTIQSVAATATRQSAREWRLVSEMSTHTEGELEFSLTMTDLAGNTSTVANADLTTANSITYDKTMPEIANNGAAIAITSNNAVTTLAKDADEVTVTFTTSEDLVANPTILIAGIAGTIVDITNRVYEYKVTMAAATHSDGQVNVSIDFSDLAGNAATTVTHDDISTIVTYDETPPLLNTVYYYNSTTGSDAQAGWTAAQYAKAGDQITMNIVSNEALMASPVVWIGQNSGAGVFADANKATVGQGANALNWVAVYNIPVAGGLQEEKLPHQITFNDAAGNAGTAITILKHATTGVNPTKIKYDESVPSIDVLTYASNNTVDGVALPTLSTSGNTITMTIGVDENVKTPVAAIHGQSSTDASSRITVTQGGTKALWTASLELGAADADINTIPISVTVTDSAGNESAALETPSNAVTVAYDKTAPETSTITITSSNTDNTKAKTGDVITVAIETNEDLRTLDNPSVKILGVTVESTRDAGKNDEFTATHTLVGTETEATIDATNATADNFSVSSFSDPTGNEGSTVLIPTSGSVTYDRTGPTVDAVAITSTSTGTNYNALYAKDGDNVILTIYTSEEISTPTATKLLGDNTNITVAATDAPTNRTWTFTKTIASATHAALTNTVAAFNISVTDPVGNSSTADAYQSLSGTGDINGDGVADNAGTVTIDLTNPNFSDAGAYVRIASNNDTDPTLAVPGNRVTLSFKVSEPIQEPTVTIATQAAVKQTPADASGIPTDTWVYYYDMTENETGGTIAFSITYADRAGNSGAAAQAALVDDSDGAVVFDKDRPTLENVTFVSDNTINNAYAKEGHTVTLAYDATEPLNSTMNVVTIHGNTVAASKTLTWDGSKESWSASYTLDAGDAAGIIPLTIDFEDLNGYDGVQITNLTANAGAGVEVTYDVTSPIITAANFTVSSDNPTAGYGKTLDNITVAFTADEALDTPVLTLSTPGGTDRTPTVSSVGNLLNWSSTYAIAGTDNDGQLSIVLTYTDLAGNAGTNRTEADSDIITVDNTAPTIGIQNSGTESPTTISSNNTNSTAAITAGTLAKPLDVLTLQFEFSETIASPVVAIAGQTPTTLTNTTGNTWQATYTTTPTTAEGPVTITIDFADGAGNSGTQFTQASLGGDNVEFDGTAPIITPVTIESNKAGVKFKPFAKSGDLVTLSFTSNEDLDTRQLSATPVALTVSIAGALPSGGGGNPASVSRTSASGGSWVYSATYEMGSITDPADEEGTVQFVLAYEDIAGNAGTDVVAITTGSNVTYDKTAPFTGSATYPYTINCTKAGTLTPKRATTDDPVTLTMVFNDEITPPTITIAGNPATDVDEGSDRTIWTAVYTMSSSDTENGNRMPITIAMTDSAGNPGTAISAIVGTDGSFVIFDKTAPSTTSLSISSNNTWDDWSPSSTHPLDPNLYAILGNTITITVIADEPLWSSTVTVLTNNAPVTNTPMDATTSSNSDKTWASTYIMQAGNLAGEIDFAITLTDSAGKTLTGLTKAHITDGSSITYDETAPDASGVVIALSSGSDTGELSNDRLTNLVRPQFDITGLTTGDSVLVETGVEILYREVVGNGISSFSDIQLTSDLTHSEVTGHEIKVYLRDPAGNLSTASTALTVRVDTELFTITSTPDLLASDDSGFLNDDDFTNVSQPSFRLTNLPPNDRDGMKVYYWPLATSEAVPSGDGTVTTGEGSDPNYRMGAPGEADIVQLDENLSAGWYAIKYTITDSAGNESAKSAQTLIYLDQTPADAPTSLDLDASTDTGILSTDNLTNLTTLTFNISDVRDTDSILVYNAAGDVLLGGGLVPAGASTAINPQDYTGTFQFIVDENLPTGTNTLSLYAKSKDVFGNLSDPTPATLSITIDTDASDVAAAAATIDLLAADDSGKSSTDNETNVLIPRFSIVGPTLSDSIYIYANGVKKGAVEATADPMEIGVGNNMGATTLTTGDYAASITVTLVDDAGNESAQSNALTVEIDTEAPNPGTTAPNLVAEDDTGWDDTDNNTSNLTNAKFEISGLTTVLDSIDLYAEGVDPVSAPVIVAKERMADPYSHTIEIEDAIPADGNYRIYYTLNDIAGNASINSDILNVVFDLTPPLPPGTPDLLSTTDLGQFSDDNITDTNNVQIKINYQEPNTRGYLKRYNVLTPDDTTTILGIYSTSADLIVGADGTKTYNQDDIIADGDSAKFIYFPVTVDSAGNEAKGPPSPDRPDLEVTYDYKDPTGIVTYSDANDTVWAGNASTVATITFYEALSVIPVPTITLTYPESGGTVGPVNLTNDDLGVNKKWRYTIDLDEPQYQDIDGYMNITITADDIAGNPVSSANLTDEDNLLFDNTKPEFRNITPETNAYINALNGFSWFLTEPLQSGIVHFDNQTLPSAADIQVALDTTEFTAYGFLTDPSAFLSGNPQLVDGHLYNITYQGIDIAGNTGMDTVYSVRYDTTMPTANLNFSRLFASEDTTVVCTVMFNEPMLASPHISLDYGGAEITANDIDSVAMVSTGNDSIWIYTATMPGGIDNQGIVKPTVYAMDLATNDLESLNIAATDSLYLDNTVATVTLSYTNITQDTILVYHPNSPPDTLRNVGIDGDTIRITVTMNEPILTSPAPTLTLKYNSGSGDTRTITSAIASNGDSIWVFTDIVLLDSTQNDGVLKVELNALDRSTNPVVNFFNQTDLLFKADNIHPAPFNMSEIRLSSVNPSLVVDWQDLANNWVDMDNDPEQHWYNERVSHFYMNVPLPPYDVPGLTDTTMWGGMVDIQFKNLRGPINGQEWVTIGASDTLDPEVNFDSTLFFRDTATVNSAIVPYNGFILGDSLLVRAVQTDIHGNKTISNFDTTDIHKFFYDRTQMNVGQLVGGNIFTQDTLFSTDTISIQWTDFLDPGGSGASGFWKYTFTVAHHTVSASDTSMKGYYNGTMWENWAEEDTAITSAAFVFNSADVDTLKHNERYEFMIFGQDLAGNMSDTLSSGIKVKYNSNPVISTIDSWTMYEDSVYGDFQHILTSDVDSLTFQSDIITYSVKTFRDGVLYTTHPIDIDFNVLSWSPKQVDVGNYTVRVIAEDISQLKDSLEFALEVIAVNDAPVLAFVDSMGFLINPDSMLVVSFDEDAQTNFTLNLTYYVDDVDNNDSTEITWQAVILDTNQLGDPFPLGQVIVGPGTSMKQKVSLMREFMGINPKSGLNFNLPKAPSVARQTRTSISQMTSGNHPITISLDTLENFEGIEAVFESDSNYYGNEHRVIFIVQDPFVPGDPNSQLESRDTLMVSVIEQNDAPIMQEIEDWNIAENDSLVLDFTSYTTDVDDSVLTFVIKALTNPEYMTIVPDSFLSDGTGDPVLLKPQLLWSEKAQIQVVAMDEAASDTSTFLLDIIRVVRPAPAVSIIQNNVFSHYLDIVIVDTVQKTTDISFEIQSETMVLDTIAPYTWTSNFDFGVEKSYSFEIHAEAVVGDTLWGNAFVLALAQSAGRWIGSSSDGSFTITGESGSVPDDQPLLIVDSTLFSRHFTDQASYIVGNENYQFQAPVRVSLASRDAERALYHRKNGAWVELPSISTEGTVITYSDQAGYYRLGQKTIIVPEITNLHPNYPNPFNPVTNIRYDIGLLDGLRQNVSIHVYNLLGQRIRTLVKNMDQLGQFTIQWDGRNETGKDMPTGIYFVQLTSSTGIVKNSKMMLLK